MARFLAAEGRRLLCVLSSLGAASVVVTLAVNLERGYPVASLAAAVGLAAVLHRLWVRAGRPRGVSEAEAAAAGDEEVVTLANS